MKQPLSITTKVITGLLVLAYTHLMISIFCHLNTNHLVVSFGAFFFYTTLFLASLYQDYEESPNNVKNT